MTGLDLVAVTAHPDDEIGCGGTLRRAADEGRAVGIIDLTAGELSTRGTPDLRAVERDRASEVLGLTARVGLGLPDAGLDASPAQCEALVGALRELRPRIVLAPYPQDRHPDHAAAGRTTRAACFLAAARRYGSGEPHRPAALYHYLVHEPFEPTFVVDVTPAWERSVRVIEAYESQFGSAGEADETPLQGPRFRAVLEARATWFGAMIGVERGEPFWSAGPIGADGPPDRPGGNVYRAFI